MYAVPLTARKTSPMPEQQTADAIGGNAGPAHLAVWGGGGDCEHAESWACAANLIGPALLSNDDIVSSCNIQCACSCV